MSIKSYVVGGALALLAALPASASSFQVLYEFPSFDHSGRSPLSLVRGQDGSFYGVMRNTVINDPDAIFRLAPPAAGQTQWQFSVLHEFFGIGTATEPGGYLQPNLLVDGSGNIYGGTYAGFNAGSRNLPTSLFRLSPPVSAGQPWGISVLYPKTPNSSAMAGLQPFYRDFGGALYGIATFGNQLSIVRPFTLSPTPHLTLLPANDPGSAVARCGGSANLILGVDGSFYGTTDTTVYRLTKPAPGQTDWSLQDIYVDPTTELCFPIIADRSLHIYSHDGSGTVYELFPPASGQGSWRKSSLYDFHAKTGSSVLSGPLINWKGVLYGVANSGPPNYSGLVFHLSAQTAGSPAVPWLENTVHIFSGGRDGSTRSLQGSEYAPALVPVTQADSSLALFGATVGGGTNGTGIIFKLVP